MLHELSYLADPRLTLAGRTVRGPSISIRQFALILGLMVVAAFPEVVFGAHTFFFRDFGLFGYPLAHYQRECFWRGEWPLWNPYNDCGIPFLAQWNTLALYPFALFYLLLPLSWSLGCFCLGHLFLGGVGAYVLARRWTAHELAASVAGVSFAFNGFTLNCLVWPNIIAALGWAPWVIWAVERACCRGRSSLMLAAFIGTAQMLTGAAEVILMTWLVAVAALLAARNPSWSSPGTALTSTWKQILGRIGAIVLVVSALSAAQLLPFFELALHSQRSVLPQADGWPMPAWGWANFILPLFRTRPLQFGIHFQPDQYWIPSCYLGVCPLALALLAAVSSRNGRVLILLAAAVFGVLLAVGNHGFLYPAMQRLFPQIGAVRYPIKAVILTALTVPLLAGLGLASWFGDNAGRSRRSWVVIVLTVAAAAIALVGTAWLGSSATADWKRVAVNGSERIAILGAFAAVLLIAPRLHLEKRCGLLWGSVLVLLWLDVVTYAPRHPTVPRWAYDAGLVDKLLPDKPRPRLGESRAMVTPAAEQELRTSFIADTAKHYLSRRAALYCNMNLLEGIPKVEGFFPLYPRAEAEVLTLIYGSTNSYPQGLVDFLGVAQRSATTNLFAWQERTNALPIVTGGQRLVFASDAETLSELASAQFDGRKVVYLPVDESARIQSVSPTKVAINAVRMSRGRLGFEVNASTNALVVVAQTYYPAWKGLLDQRPIRILRANHAFQAVEVPPGSHTVELRYQDDLFHWGCLISGLTLLGSAAYWLSSSINARRALSRQSHH
ncbi:MAG: hypothetical protein U1G07_11820 [Verrucomicrobiota bacterium]